MHDNKVRLSRDVLTKAEQIAAEWGLKNARAAVEAVFRRYCDDYLYSREAGGAPMPMMGEHLRPQPAPRTAAKESCDALEALDELLAL